MSILGVNSALAGAYQYANRTQKTGTNRTGFMERLQKTGEAAETSKVDAYTEYLRSKYGNVRIQSIGKDQKSLDRAGKSMSGSDVVIAPNILEQMANDPEKAAYYEGKIDDFFEATPRLKASFAAQGLDYQPCGVVVQTLPEGGIVTLNRAEEGDYKPPPGLAPQICYPCSAPPSAPPSCGVWAALAAGWVFPCAAAPAPPGLALTALWAVFSSNSLRPFSAAAVCS